MLKQLFTCRRIVGEVDRKKHAFREADQFAVPYDPGLPFFMQKTFR